MGESPTGDILVCVDEGLKSDGCDLGAMSPLQGMGYVRAALQFLEHASTAGSVTCAEHKFRPV